MKRIGLIGGLSWHSTAEYYRLINEEVNKRLGGDHSADLIIVSLDFESVLIHGRQGHWDEATKPLIHAAKQLEKAGADFFLLCSNAIHKLVPLLMPATNLPLLHIADAVGKAIQKQGLKTVGLLGTKVTMEEDFYSIYLQKQGITTLTPLEKDRNRIHELIFAEFIKGIFTDTARIEHENIMHDLKNKGAEGIILGCTEIPLLFANKECELPLFDTLKIHALAAVDKALI